jgi:hypothetical protein
MRLYRARRRAALAGLMGVPVATVLVACSAPADQPATAAGFAGYKWAVVSISHDGKTTPVPGKYSVYLRFTPDGHFGANEPINHHGGSYRVTPGGFTTSGLHQTLAGYTGRDPVILLSASAIGAFNNEKEALANVSGNTLTVTVGSYTLVAQRAGRQANF